MKTKEEKITLFVDYTITYEPTKKAGRRRALQAALEGCPQVTGVSIEHGFYSAKRGKISLRETHVEGVSK